MEDIRNQLVQNINDNQNSNQNDIPKSNKKQNKKKKHKKHKFLKAILFLVVLFFAFKGVRYVGDTFAEKKLNSFMQDYPFVFSSEDNYKTVTENFKVKDVFELDGKKYKVTWSSNNNCITFNNDEAIVSNTTPKNKIVEISANYSILGGLGKASKTFDINVLTKNKIELEDVNVVKVDSVKNNSYDRNMNMTMTSNGDVEAMYGDFKQSIYTVEDCYTVLKAYKNNLNINKDCDFKLYDVMYGNDTTTYIFCLAVNDYKINDKKIYICVDNNDDYSIQSIKCNFNRDISNYPKTKRLSDIEIYNLLSSTYNRTRQNTIFAYNDYEYKTIDNNIYLVGDYTLVYDNGEIHEIYVDVINGKIIKELDSANYFFDEDKGDMEDCTGMGVMFDTKNFPAYKLDDKYYLYDKDRKIKTYKTTSSYNWYNIAVDNLDWYYQYKDSDNPLVEIGVLVGVITNYGILSADEGISTTVTRKYIESDNNEFNDEMIAVDAYYNIRKAYDYYKNNFNITSYDNKGSMINLYVDNKMQKDNACWNNSLKAFFINPVEHFLYSFAKDAEVLGHEYTHGVFSGYTDGYGEEISGLNEAYADIFGVFINGYTNWKIGENVYDGKKLYTRDLTDINSPESSFSVVYGKPAPEEYHNSQWDEWNGEEHAIACMIGHIAYQMYSSGAFTNTELENIWYKSLTYGYSGEDTYVTCRRQILQAMNDLNGSEFNGRTFSFSEKQRDLVRSFFDQAKIIDTSDSYECVSDAIEGDLMKDDSNVHRFATVVFPIAYIANKTPIYIYEECETKSDKDEQTIQNKLNEYWDSIMENDMSNQNQDFVGAKGGNTIVYKQVEPWQMDWLQKWIGKTDSDFDSFLEKNFNSFGDSENNADASLLKKIKALVYLGRIDSTTRYEYYSSLFDENS